jgi:hypothetical protein
VLAPSAAHRHRAEAGQLGAEAVVDVGQVVRQHVLALHRAFAPAMLR